MPSRPISWSETTTPWHPGLELSFHLGPWDFPVCQAQGHFCLSLLYSVHSFCAFAARVGVEVLYIRSDSNLARSLQSSQDMKLWNDHFRELWWSLTVLPDDNSPHFFSASRTVFKLEKINIPKAFWDHFITAHFKCLRTSSLAWKFQQCENTPVDSTFLLPIHSAISFNLLHTLTTLVKLYSKR